MKRIYLSVIATTFFVITSAHASSCDQGAFSGNNHSFTFTYNLANVQPDLQSALLDSIRLSVSRAITKAVHY